MASGLDRRWWAAGAAAGLTIVVAVVVLVTRAPKSGASDRALIAFSELSYCLIGEPLAESESLLERLHRIELAESYRANSDWPTRCSAYADDYAAELKSATGADIGASVQPLSQGRLPDAQRVWESARELGDKLPVVGDVPRAPQDAELRVDISWQPAEPRPVSVAPSLGSELRLSFGERGRACLVGGADVDSVLLSARCFPAAAAGTPKRRWLAAQDGAPPYLQIESGSGGWFVQDAASGRRVVGEDFVAGSVAGDGNLTLLRHPTERGGWHVVHQLGDGEPVELRVDFPRREPAALLSDQMLWVSGKPDDRRLFARSLSGGKLGPALELGAFPGSDAPRYQVCGTRTRLAIAIASAEQSVLSFRVGGSYRPLVPLPKQAGSLACDGGSAWVTLRESVSSDGGLSVEQAICNAERCTQRTLRFPGLAPLRGARAVGSAAGGEAPGADSVALTPLGGELLLSWLSAPRASRFGGTLPAGVWLRVGPAAKPSEPRPQLLATLAPGEAAQASSIHAFSRGDVALLLVLEANAKRVGRVAALRVASSGEVRSVSLGEALDTQ